MADADRYRWFRIEATELLDQLTRGLLALERRDDAASVATLQRHAHTLKGAARVVGAARAAEQAHALEEALEALEAPDASAHAMEAALSAVDAIAAAVAALPSGPAAPAAPAASHPSEPLPVPRGNEKTLDALDAALVEASTRLRRLRQQLDRAHRTAPALARRLDDEVAVLTHQLGEAEQLARTLRLSPIRTLVPALERAVRDACLVTGRQARLVVSGDEHRIDTEMLAILRDALDQVVRNAVVHGIEPPDARAAAGKPAEGRITVHIDRRGGRLELVCRDDGRGLDVAALSQRSGGADPWAAIFTRGLSTVDGVTPLAGRGVGLDVVAENIRRMGGEVRGAPSPTGGLSIEILVPISRVSMRVLVAEAAGFRVGVPLEAVVRAVPWSAAKDDRRVLVGGEPLRYVPLAGLFRKPAVNHRSQRRLGIVVRTPEEEVVLGVDELVGDSEVMVRPLCRGAGHVPAVAALFLGPEGVPIPVLDTTELAVLLTRELRDHTTAAEARALPILVVDDSLTTRMLERSILEAAGYEVHTASSGEEALQLAGRRAFGLFVVDVQMPGMSGLDFVRLTRADERLRSVPAILVTSLASADDRRRGLEAGADAYVVKGEFEQQAFLGIVGGLVGAS